MADSSTSIIENNFSISNKHNRKSRYQPQTASGSARKSLAATLGKTADETSIITSRNNNELFSNGATNN